MTPEGKTKALIGRTLKKHRENIYVFMPVPGGYGRSTLDYIGFCRGMGFAIEAKRPGGKLTDRQLSVVEAIEGGGARVFIIDGIDGVEELDSWLMALTTG